MKKTALFLILALAAMGSASCATDKKTAPELSGYEPALAEGLRHVVALAPFTDATGGKPAADEASGNRVADLAANGCGRRAVIRPFSPPGLAVPPAGTPMGLTDSAAWVKAAREAGANLLVSGILWDSVMLSEKRGLYGFREKVPVAKARLSVWVYDTATGAKVLDDALDCETILTELKAEGVVSEKAVACSPVLREDLAAQGARSLCRALQKTEWRAFVLSVEGDVLAVGAGSDAGIRLGEEFLVHAPGAPVPGPGGKTLLAPGEPAGRARVISVEKDRSRAKLITGTAPPGASLRPVR